MIEFEIPNYFKGSNIQSSQDVNYKVKSNSFQSSNCHQNNELEDSFLNYLNEEDK